MKKRIIILTILIVAAASCAVFADQGSFSPWAEQYINSAAEMKIMPDSLEGKDLTEDITREEFAELAVRLYEKLSGEKPKAPEERRFSDCDNPEVEKAAELGITDGVGGGLFAPAGFLTREQGAAMLTRAYKKYALPGWTLESNIEFETEFINSFAIPHQFSDAYTFSDWAMTSISFMRARSIIDGVGDNKFNAKGHLSREQAVKIAVKMLAVTGSPDFAPMDALLTDCIDGDSLYTWFEDGKTVVALFGADAKLIRTFHTASVNSELFQQLSITRYSAQGWYSGLAGLFRVQDHDIAMINGRPVKDLIFVRFVAGSSGPVILTWEDKDEVLDVGMPADTIISLSDDGQELVLLSRSDNHGIAIAGLEPMDRDIMFYTQDDVGMMHFDSFSYVLASGSGGIEAMGPGVREIWVVGFTAGRPEMMEGFSWEEPEGYMRVYMERERERLRGLSLLR